MYVTSRRLSPAVFIQSARRLLIAGGMAIFSAIQVLYAQTTADTSAELALIGAAMSLRQEALSGPQESFDQFNQLISEWDSLGIDEVGRHGVLLNIWAYSAIQGAGSRRVLKAAKRTYQTDTLPFDAAGIQAIKERELLADLISNGLLQTKFPYRISPDGLVIKEILQYNLHPGMRIAEIGAGSGTISWLIGGAYDSLTMYINELSPFYLNTLHKRQNRLAALMRPSNVITIQKGRKRSTGLKGEQLDLIFIRQTFHHFKYKNLMLESIKASLRPGGEVIIVESVSDDFKKEEMPCAETVSMAEILKHFEDHRFFLVKKEKIGEQWLFRWKK